jgi:hypothetical protein
MHVEGGDQRPFTHMMKKDEPCDVALQHLKDKVVGKDGYLPDYEVRWWIGAYNTHLHLVRTTQTNCRQTRLRNTKMSSAVHTLAALLSRRCTAYCRNYCCLLFSGCIHTTFSRCQISLSSPRQDKQQRSNFSFFSSTGQTAEILLKSGTISSWTRTNLMCTHRKYFLMRTCVCSTIPTYVCLCRKRRPPGHW